ncbi:MAG: cryptochrome/photolyase family protein [Solirubrobacteraceae bacterium]
MPATAVVWFRRDLRVHDHPALAEACREFERVVPLFVFDPRLLGGRFRSLNRTAWMLDCLRELDGELRERGARLVTRHGAPHTEVRSVAAEVGASAVYVSDDVTGFARARDDAVEAALARDGVQLRRRPGVYIADLDAVRTKQGRPYTVFTPFLRAWRAQERRPVERAPRAIAMPRVPAGHMPSLSALGFDARAPELQERPEPGEAAAKRAARRWLRSEGLRTYADGRDTLAQPTSRMSAYLRFGVLSPLWLERQVAGGGGTGAGGYQAELAWRDFYGAVQLHFPHTARQEFQERYRGLKWDHDAAELCAWKEGRTGYPVVDAAMRELLACGWMHNRARMIVGSFLTKDLGEDWRAGEAHFMEHLIDGDVGSNNGGWQWIASTGTDPAPYFQRLFNPTTQQRKFDPDGAYVRRWVPELARVPDERLAEPWTMSDEEQAASGCRIGRDYPEPLVDHADARRRAIARYRAAGDAAA